MSETPVFRDSVAFGVTVPITAYAFLNGQLRYLAESGVETHLVSSQDDNSLAFCQRNMTKFHAVNLTRQPSVSDLIALTQIWRVLRRTRPTVSVMGTPKMGFLGSIAAKIAGVPKRVYLVHGLRFEGATGWRRLLLGLAEVIPCVLSTDIVAVSPSVASSLSRQLRPLAIRPIVLRGGSANGVNSSYFRPPTASERRQARARLGADPEKTICLFLGRMTHDKGIRALLELANSDTDLPDMQLILGGDAEPRNREDSEVIAKLEAHRRVTCLPHVDDVRPLYWASDVFVLPTRREGLPTVLLEAQSCGVPIVSTRVTGVVDAVSDESALLAEWSDHAGIIALVRTLANDPTSRTAMGRAGRSFVEERFTQAALWSDWRTLLESHLER